MFFSEVILLDASNIDRFLCIEGFFFIYINIYISTVSWHYKEHKAHLQLPHVQLGWDHVAGMRGEMSQTPRFPLSGGHLGGPAVGMAVGRCW